MGRRRGKKSQTKKVDARSHRRSPVSSGGRRVDARNVSDTDANQSFDRLRPLSSGILRSILFVMACSLLCLCVTWLVLKAWLAVPDEEVVPKIFKGIGEQAYNQGITGSISILVGIATIALALRGMSWRERELPTDSRLHRAWLQKIIDDSAREGWSFVLLILLCGLYGAVVVIYGFLAGYNGWSGISRILVIFLFIMYIVVATLPAFVAKSEIGTIRGYAETLVRLANLGEWRYLNLRDSELRAKKIFVTKRVLPVLWGEDVVRPQCRPSIFRFLFRFLFRLLGLLGAMLFVGAVFIDSGAAGMSFKKILYTILLFFWSEVALVWILGLKCRLVSMVDFGVVVELVLVTFYSLLAWGVQIYVIPGCLVKGITAILFLWWCVRAALAFSMKPPRHRRWWPSGLWERLSVMAGLHCVMGVWVDQVLQEVRRRMVSYHDDNVQVANELSAAAGLIIPEECVVNRSRDDGRVEEKNLRGYLSEVVKVTLPPASKPCPDSGK